MGREDEKRKVISRIGVCIVRSIRLAYPAF